MPEQVSVRAQPSLQLMLSEPVRCLARSKSGMCPGLLGCSPPKADPLCCMSENGDLHSRAKHALALAKDSPGGYQGMFPSASLPRVLCSGWA